MIQVNTPPPPTELLMALVVSIGKIHGGWMLGIHDRHMDTELASISKDKGLILETHHDKGWILETHHNH